MMVNDSPVVWTIGHSSRTLETFVALLKGEGIAQIADVRSYPGSRSFPHFNRGLLAESLGESGIRYLHLPELGGRRAPNPGSTNTVWENAAFRAYADHMETPEFRAGLSRLLQIASERPTAVLCAEALWWQCHRSMIADALKAAGIKVLHIMGGGKTLEHPYTSAARVVDGRLHYGARVEDR